MRYVRKQRKSDKQRQNLLNPLKNDPMDYDFPELDEFFIYNPKTNGTGNPMQTSSTGGMKMTKDSVAYLHFRIGR